MPTEEGSIVGYLRLNDSEWNKTLDEASAKAHELPNPDIRINVEATEALAKIEAVRAAEARIGGINVGGTGSAAKLDEVAAAQKRLTAAMSAADTAYARAAITAGRLNEVESKRGHTELQVASATLANSEAQKRLESANEKATVAEEALASAQKRAAETAIAQAAAAQVAAAAIFEQRDATEAQAKASNNAAASGAGHAGVMGVIVAAAIALLPVLAAVAGTALAVTGALAGMGAAGVLAVIGIRNAMAAGTAAGNTYSAGLHTLKGDLDQLSNTAATAMLQHFTAALSIIDQYMPSLNAEIGLFSGQLGATANIVLRALVTGFQILNPLFLQAGAYVESLAVGWLKWTSGGGLAQFARDAAASLPQVVQALGAIVGAALSLLGALQPLGTLMLGIVTVAANLVTILTNGLGPAFLPVVAGAAAALVIFKQWSTIGPIIEQVAWKLGAVGVAAEAASGPIGWIIGAVALVAAGFATVAIATSDAAKAQTDYTAAVQEDNGVIGKNVSAQAAKALADKGALTVAQQLGISTKTLTQATLGHTDAQDKLKKKINALNVELQALDRENANAATHSGGNTAKAAQLASQLQTLTQAYTSEKTSITDTIKAYNDVAQAQGLTTITTKQQLDAVTALAAKYGMSVPQMLAAEGAQKQNADQAAATTQQLQFENDAATLLTNAFTLLNGGMLSVAQAQTGAAAATNTLLDSFKQNGHAIDGNTKAAVANQQAIEQKVVADQQAAEAIAKQTGSTQAGTKAYKDSKVALENQLRATHNLTPAIQAYIDKLYDVKNLKVPPTVLEIDRAAFAKAQQHIADFKSMLASITRNIQVGVTVVASGPTSLLATTGGKRLVFAGGGPVPEYHAGGGVVGAARAAYLAGGGNPFQPQGTDTVPAMLTKGEFVVKAASAAYSPPFLKAFNDNPQAATAALQAKGAPQVHHHHQWTVYASDPEQLYQGFMNRINSRHV